MYVKIKKKHTDVLTSSVNKLKTETFTDNCNPKFDRRKCEQGRILISVLINIITFLDTVSNFLKIPLVLKG